MEPVNTQKEAVLQRMTAGTGVQRRKFSDPLVTVDGKPRARVSLQGLASLWINTGTLCNLACRRCYIESSPRNDRLAYMDVADVVPYFDEIRRNGWNTRLIGFTGGEPFMNPEFPQILEAALARGFEVLILTNAMRPMEKRRQTLWGLKHAYGARMAFRVSLDHYRRYLHEDERGPKAWRPAIEGLSWLLRNGFTVSVAGRLFCGQTVDEIRDGYRRLFRRLEIRLDAHNASDLVLFPEMDARTDVPEITESCWQALNKSPCDVMCSSSRMIVKRKEAHHPVVVACTLLPYAPEFELGRTLADAAQTVSLNHPHCARFCVLGGASCSP